MVLSLFLIFLDYRHYLPTLRRTLNDFVAPLQYFVDKPIAWADDLKNDLATQAMLRTENARLATHQLLLEAKLQQFAALESENHQLNQLLASSSSLKKQHLQVARLLSVNADPLLNEVILDKGQADSVCVGQPVIDADGVLGQVISVDKWTSRILLLTDFRSAIPVQDVRSEVRGILVGHGRLAKLILKDIPGTLDIRVNDLLVTSGLGGHYPPGYPVGVVSSVNSNVAAPFALIEVDPSAQLNRNRPVLLIQMQEAQTASSSTGSKKPLPVSSGKKKITSPLKKEAL
jgi:rod shape-determining protein MreC